MDALYLHKNLSPHRGETAAGAVRSHAQGKTPPTGGNSLPRSPSPFRIQKGFVIIVCGCFIFTVLWKYGLFIRFSPWREPRLRRFSGYPFGTSRKKASTIFYNTAFKNSPRTGGNDGHRPFIRAGQTLLTRGKFPAKPEKRTSEAAPYRERPSFLSNAPRLCFTSLHAQRKASNKCRRSPRAWNRRALKSLPPASFRDVPPCVGQTPVRRSLHALAEDIIPVRGAGSVRGAGNPPRQACYLSAWSKLHENHPTQKPEARCSSAWNNLPAHGKALIRYLRGSSGLQPPHTENPFCVSSRLTLRRV